MKYLIMFIQWVGCCCSGAHGVCEDVKEEKADLCRDVFAKHFAQSKACLELAKFPPSIPLYSGVHGETVVTTETRWMSNCNNDPSSNLSDEISGTRVLIPVIGGLVELFAFRNVLEDEKVIEFVRSQFMIKMEYTSENLDIQPQFPFFGPYSCNGYSSIHHLNLKHGPKNSIFPSLPELNTYQSFEGSSSGSNPIRVSPNGSVNELIQKNQVYTTPDRDINLSFDKETVHAVNLIERENLNTGAKLEKDQYHSKNLITERNRRMRIKDGLLTLRSLVPKISKMDKASILVDAIAYIEELHNEKQQLEDELLKESKEDECNKNKDPKKRDRDQLCSSKATQIPTKIEVTQIGIRDFLVEVSSAHKQGGFLKLIEVMCSLGLQVIDANSTTFDGQTMNIFKVEVNTKGFQPNTLKDSLVNLMSNLHKTARRI